MKRTVHKKRKIMTTIVDNISMIDNKSKQQ